MTTRPASLLVALVAVATGACTRGPEAGDECFTLTVTDLCASTGLACTPDYTNSSSTGAFCELPGETFSCLPSVGCVTRDLRCIGPSDGGECLRSCASNADCWDPLTTCQDAGGSQLCLETPCSNLFQTCAASTDGGDGTCIPTGVSPAADNPGACLQGGGAATGSPCVYYRASGANLCAPGLTCFTALDGLNVGICMAVCNGLEGDLGPSCGADTCVDSLPPAPVPDGSVIQPYLSRIDYFNQLGGCATPCGLAGTGIADAGCTDNLACVDSSVTLALLPACLPD